MVIQVTSLLCVFNNTCVFDWNVCSQLGERGSVIGIFLQDRVQWLDSLRFEISSSLQHQVCPMFSFCLYVYNICMFIYINMLSSFYTHEKCRLRVITFFVNQVDYRVNARHFGIKGALVSQIPFSDFFSWSTVMKTFTGIEVHSSSWLRVVLLFV